MDDSLSTLLLATTGGEPPDETVVWQYAPADSRAVPSGGIAETDVIRESTPTGRPPGTAEFIPRLERDSGRPRVAQKGGRPRKAAQRLTAINSQFLGEPSRLSPVFHRFFYGQTDATYKVLEARVGAQGVEDWLYVEVNEWRGAILIRFF